MYALNSQWLKLAKSPTNNTMTTSYENGKKVTFDSTLTFYLRSNQQELVQKRL